MVVNLQIVTSKAPRFESWQPLFVRGTKTTTPGCAGQILLEHTWYFWDGWCLGYLKTSNTEPTDWVYKKCEGVFSLSGREVTQCMATQQSPVFHCQEEQLCL